MAAAMVENQLCREVSANPGPDLRTNAPPYLLLDPLPGAFLVNNLAIFDLDHTLLDGDSDYLWGRFLVEQGMVDGDSYERKNHEFYLAYQAGTLDIDAFAAFSLKPLTQYEPEQLYALRQRFVAEKIEPCVSAGTPDLLRRHREQGDTLIITTATNRFITEPIAALLGVPNLLATDPEIIDGRYTGRLSGHANFREGKVLRLRAWLELHRILPTHSTCYSDSHNDLPLLEFADTAVAVDPDPTLLAEAQRRGWAVISLKAA
ncbi:MAG: family hydrolase [Nevskia sp.]|nr:family hydrolase [Nevskia sp.]